MAEIALKSTEWLHAKQKDCKFPTQELVWWVLEGVGAVCCPEKEKILQGLVALKGNE